MKFTLETIKPLAAKKPVYLYAVNLEGVGYSKLFARLGFDVKGFIDSRKFENGLKRGLPIIDPDVFFSSPDAKNAFIIIASKHRETRNLAIEKCEKAGLVRNISFVAGSDLCDYLPTVEVVGACNLKCITCNMGLSDAFQGGMMKPEAYRKVLAKMTQEIPFMNSVCLYLWGEPFMNPDLPEIIRITSEYGIACEISTNLNYGKHIDRIIEANPDVLTIPCSGIGKNYEMTHTKGNWETFKKNLYTLRESMNRHKADTTTRVFFHMYKHNLGEDYDTVEKMTKELNFHFFPIIATIFPEKVFEYAIYNKPLPPEMQKANEMLIVSVDENLKVAYENRHRSCPFMKSFPAVRWDLSILHCSNMINPTVHPNYLQIPLDELNEVRAKAPTCGQCMSKGVHRFFDVNGKIEMVDGKRVITPR